MQITLRAARKLEDKIKKFLKESSLEIKSKISITKNVQETLDVLDRCQEKLMVEVSNRLRLLELRFKIRDLISKANHDSGINSLVTRRSAIQEMIQEMTPLFGAGERASEKELGNMLSFGLTRMSKGETYFGEDLFFLKLDILEIDNLSKIKNKKIELTNELENIENSLMELNFTTKIELDDSSASFMKQYNLL